MRRVLPDPVLVVSRLSAADMDGLSGQPPVSQTEGGGGPTVQHRLHATLTLAVVTSLEWMEKLDYFSLPSIDIYPR